MGVIAFKNCDGSESLRIRTRNYKVSELPTVIPRLLPLFFDVKFLHELSVLFGIWLRLVIFNALTDKVFLFLRQRTLCRFLLQLIAGLRATRPCAWVAVNWRAHPKRMNEESVNPITRNEGQKPELIWQSPYPGFKQKKKRWRRFMRRKLFPELLSKWVISKLLAKEKSQQRRSHWHLNINQTYSVQTKFSTS